MAKQSKPSAAPAIFTSCWHSTIDEQRFCRIGISRSTPRGQAGYRRYPKLNPGPWFRSIPDEREWAARYREEILAPLDAGETVKALHALAEGRTPVLLCWEPPEPGEDYCHRGLVAAWLWESEGMKVCELGFEAAGYGPSHPKLPRALRR